MKARHLSIVAKKEFRGLFNERTILLAVLLQLFIAMFSSFLMVGLTSMYDPTSLSKRITGTMSPMPGTIPRSSRTCEPAPTSGSTRWISPPGSQRSRSENFRR